MRWSCWSFAGCIYYTNHLKYRSDTRLNKGTVQSLQYTAVVIPVPVWSSLPAVLRVPTSITRQMSTKTQRARCGADELYTYCFRMQNAGPFCPPFLNPLTPAVGGLKAGHRVALMPWLWLRPCLVLEGHSRPYLVVIVGSVTIKESFDVGIAFPHLHAQNGSKWTWGIMSTTYSSTGGFHPGHTNNQTV